jgi:hypothetical protein
MSEPSAEPGAGSRGRFGLRRWRRRLLAALVLVFVIGVAAAGTATGANPLRASGPVEVIGSTAHGSFTIGDTTIRQVRYLDRGRLEYAFDLVNTTAAAIRVTGVASDGPTPTLLRLETLTLPGDTGSFLLGPFATRRVSLTMLMTDCERLSARAGTVLGALRVRAMVLGVAPRTVTVALPESLRLSSAREAWCPRATASSRSPG